jgi:hypothetical protein
MLKIRQICELLQDRRHIVISKSTGVPRQTIKRVSLGKNCNVESLEKLSEYFEKQMKLDAKESKSGE